MVGAFAGISMMLWYELARAVFYESVREVPYRSGIADYGGLEGKLDEGRD